MYFLEHLWIKVPPLITGIYITIVILAGILIDHIPGTYTVKGNPWIQNTNTVIT